MLSNVAQPESGVIMLKKLLTAGNNVGGKTLFNPVLINIGRGCSLFAAYMLMKTESNLMFCCPQCSES